jgi:hypothetical protein
VISPGLRMVLDVQVQPIKMTLLENSYDFLNESLRAAERAEGDPHAWKFAVLHMVQAVELLLKARLQAAHPSLIYENVDAPKRTVTLQQAVGRIAGAVRIPLTSRELRKIRKGSQWRDQIVHFEFEMSPYQVEAVYSQLFEFMTRFHNDHTDFGELHAHIARDLWAKEAELIEFFRREVVLYNDVEVSRSWPATFPTATWRRAHAASGNSSRAGACGVKGRLTLNLSRRKLLMPRPSSCTRASVASSAKIRRADAAGRS